RAVGAGGVLVLCLFGGWRDMPLAGRSPLCSGRLGGYSAVAAVIASVVDPDVVDDGLVVNIGDARHVGDVIHRAVIEEGSMIPMTAFIAATRVTESIVDAAVVPDLRTPVPVVPDERAAVPFPIARSP